GRGARVRRGVAWFGDRGFRESGGGARCQPSGCDPEVVPGGSSAVTASNRSPGGEMSLNATLVKSTVIAALGCLLFGFDTAVISGTTAELTQTYQLSPGLLGVTVASALWGTILGAMLAGCPGARYGRRDSLRVMAVLYVISAVGCAVAWNWYSLVLFRLIGGLGIGGWLVLRSVEH